MINNEKIYINKYFNAIIVLGDIMKLKKGVKRFLFLILIIIILLIYFSFSKKESKKENKELSINDKIVNQCKKTDYCNEDYINRYVKYYKKNKDLSIDNIFTRVNLNLDYSFYTHTKKSKYLNSTNILVNKYYYLDEDYVPDNLETIPEEFARNGMKLVNIAKDGFISMARDASKENIKIIAMSSYRSYDYQIDLYNKYVTEDGVNAADTYSGRAGFSEHQTGLCIDVYDGDTDYTNFENTDSFKWMQKNSYKYGFILRFPKNKESITGYQYESWHYRYVGKKIAKYIYENNITFDEYYVKFIENKIK